MQLKKTIILLALLIASLPLTIYGQSRGDWTLYPSYTNVTETVMVGNRLYVLASGSLFSYDTDTQGNAIEGSLTTYTKTNGLNDHIISHIAWVEATNRLLIVYQNSNIDLLTLSSPRGSRELQVFPSMRNQEGGLLLGEGQEGVSNISAIKNSTISDNKTINSVNVVGKLAYLSSGNGIFVIDTDNETITDYYRLGFKVMYSYIKDGALFAASSAKGIYSCALTDNLNYANNWKYASAYTAQPAPAIINPKVRPDGPLTNDCYRITIDRERIYIAPGMRTVDIDKGNPGNVFWYNGTNWEFYENDIAARTGLRYLDNCIIAVDPFDRDHVFVGGKNGLFEFREGKFIKDYRYGSEGVPFETAVPTSSNPKNWGIITGMTFDKDGNLYVLNSECAYIPILKRNGEWDTREHSVILAKTMNGYPTGATFDSEGRFWYCSTQWEKSCIFVYEPSTDKLTRIDDFYTEEGCNYKCYNYDLAIDSTQNVWVASNLGPLMIKKENIDKGKYIFSNVEEKNTEGGMSKLLLNGMPIYSVAVDSENRKWFGTFDNGVYCVSATSNEILYHFNIDNSPLPSNTITGITPNAYDGRIYFATGSGMCSVKIPSNRVGDELPDPSVTVSPSPVVPSYKGQITISGLSAYNHIRILSPEDDIIVDTDITNGSYVWSIIDRSNHRIAPGVYRVYSADGKLITRIMVSN